MKLRAKLLIGSFPSDFCIFSLGVPLYLGVKVLFFWKLTWALEMKKPTEQSFHKGLSFNDGSQIFAMKFEAALVLETCREWDQLKNLQKESNERAPSWMLCWFSGIRGYRTNWIRKYLSSGRSLHFTIIELALTILHMSLLLSAKFEPRSASNCRAEISLASGEEAGWHSGFCRATSLYMYRLLVISIVTGKESNGLTAMVTWWEIPTLATINLDINIRQTSCHFFCIETDHVYCCCKCTWISNLFSVWLDLSMNYRASDSLLFGNGTQPLQ